MLEGLLRSYNDMFGLPVCCTAIFNVYGPRMDIHGKYTEVLVPVDGAHFFGQPPLILGDGKHMLMLAALFSMLVAGNLAFFRHLRRVNASPRSGGARRG